MIRASTIIRYSNETLSMMSIPNIGKLESIKGKTAQCIAQASDVVIPSASQLILKFIGANIVHFATVLQNKCLNNVTLERYE